MTEERPSEPTVPPDETTVTPPPVPPPAYSPPTSMPPGPAPQPPVAWAAPPTAVVVTAERTPLSLGAGILLILLGALGALAALAALTIGRQVIQNFDFTTLPGLERVNNPGAFVESALTFGAIVLLAFSTFYIVGGVGILRSRNWGRVIGIVIGILAGLFWLAGVAGGGQARGGEGFALVLLAIHAYVAIVLLFFWKNKAPA
jgi:uncharacterized membrane protein (DUF2068 family)